MRRVFVFLFLKVLFAISINAQNSLNDLNIIFKHDFENNTVGNYLYDEWSRDWLNPAWCERQSELKIATNTSDPANPTKTLQLDFPANSVGPSEGGTQWWTHFENKDEVYYSYDVYFMSGFQYQLGGKIPSVHGGDATPNIQPDGYDFLHVGLMFKEEGRIVFYVYFPDSKEQISGETFTWGENDYPSEYFSPSSLVIEDVNALPVYCKPGEWHNLTYRVALNTVKSTGGGNYDGILEAYFDGKMVTQISHLLFRHTTELGIDCININSFFGGSTDEWRNPIDEWLRLDNVMLYTFKDNISVPRGNTLSPTSRTINYWRKLSDTNFESFHLDTPLSPSSLTSSEFTDTSITVTWNDNSTNENSFVITRSLAVNPSASIEIKVHANDTVFTDSKLEASTTYVYTVKAMNDAGNSPASNKYVASTLSLAETKRVKDGLVAYYNFGYDPGFIIHDQSGYGDPLDLKVMQRTAVSWNQENKLDMLSNTALVSLIPAKKLINALKKTNEITIECWIKPIEPEFSANSRILSLANNDDEIGFVLDQEFTGNPDASSLSYRVRLQTESTNPSGFPEYIPDQNVSYINLQHLAYVRDSLGKEVMYVNGVKSSEGFRPSNLNTWNDNYYLRMGNESDLNHSWKGTFYLVAIYNKALSLNEINTNYTAGPSDSLTHESINYDVSVYPNPVTDQVTIEIVPMEIQDIVPQTFIKVLDIYGKTHYQKTVFDPNNRLLETIDFKNFSKGFYLLQVISGNQLKSIKLVVQ